MSGLSGRVRQLERKSKPPAPRARLFVRDDGADTGRLNGEAITLDAWEAMRTPADVEFVIVRREGPTQEQTI